jgi:hypothetical protein
MATVEDCGNDIASRHTHPDRVFRIYDTLAGSSDTSGSPIEWSVDKTYQLSLNNCDVLMHQWKSKQDWISSRTLQSSKVSKKHGKPIRTFGTQTQGINGPELQWRKAGRECQRCAFPQDKKPVIKLYSADGQ